MTEYPLLTTLLGGNPQAKMRRAYQLAVSVPWIRTAERVISGKGSTVEWHLEDADDVEIDDENGDMQQQRARSLIEKPQANVTIGRKLTRRELWALTLRHMGVCGTAFWYLDQRDIVAGTPDATLYIRPDRMTPKQDDNGNLLFWSLDERPDHPGTRLELNEVAQFNLEPPDTGHFGIGLVESALLKAQNSTAFDQHVAQVLSAGGRLSGILSPKDGDSLDNNQYQQMVADMRTVVEQPDAAKRVQVMRGPVDFAQTTMTIRDLQLRDMMQANRDDLLTLWGLPLTQAGGSEGGGLNSGTTKKDDRQTLWENAIHPRLVVFVEVVQYEILDRWQQLGATVELELDEPSFDDDGARFDLLLKSISLPLRNWERRELVGREPFGPKVLNPETGLPLDDEVWLPNTQQRVFVAPEEGEGLSSLVKVIVEAVPSGSNPAETTGQLVAGSETAQAPRLGSGQPAAPASKAVLRPSGAALLASTRRLRAGLDERVTPRLKQSVAGVLGEQKREIAQRAKAAAAHLMQRSSDTAVWWDGPRWERRMREALAPQLTHMAEELDVHLRRALPAAQGKAGPVGAVTHVLTRSGARITGLNDRTRAAVLTTVRQTVARGIADGKSPAQVGDDLYDAIDGAALDSGTGLWDLYRAEMIARTEMMGAYNAAAVGSYGDMGVEKVQAIDGDGDEECAARDGQVFDIDEADTIEDHPNGTLDWLPVLPEEGDET